MSDSFGHSSLHLLSLITRKPCRNASSVDIGSNLQSHNDVSSLTKWLSKTMKNSSEIKLIVMKYMFSLFSRYLHSLLEYLENYTLRVKPVMNMFSVSSEAFFSYIFIFSVYFPIYRSFNATNFITILVLVRIFS